MTFGKYIREERLKQNLSLREFCKLINESPCEWSMIERGLKSPPTGLISLFIIMLVLNIPSDKFHYLRELIYSHMNLEIDKDLNSMLPAFICTRNGNKLTIEDIKSLANDLTR